MNKIKLYLLIFIAFVSIIVIGWYINSYLSQSRANNQSENYITGLVRHQTFLGGTNSNSLIDVNDFQLNTETSTVLYYPLQVRNWTAGGNLKQWSSFELYNPNNNPVNAQVFIYGVAPDNQGSAFTVTIPAKSYIRSQDLSEFNNLISGYPNGRVFWVKIFFPNANNGLLGINKWRLLDGTKTNAPIVDTDISNLQTKSEKNLVAPLITIKGSTTMSNATQWTDIIVVNVKEDQARIRITFNGKIGQNNTVQTKRIEKTIERYGYYSTYGDQSWYNLFKDNNGQIQSATGWARVDVIGGNGEIIGLTRSRILNGQSYNSPLIYVNDENLVIPQKELYVPLAFFGYESGMPDHTQWTNIVISNLLDETNKVNFEYIPLTGENLNKSSFSVNIEPKGQYNSYGRTEWLNLAANGRKYGWIKITSDQLNQAVLVGMARWTLRSGSESRNSARIVSDMVLTSKIQGKTYVPFSSQPQQIASGSLQYEKYNFVAINTNQNGIRLNLALSGSNYNFNNLPISAYGLFNSYSNSSLQQINYTGWGEVSVLAVNPTNTPTAVPTSFYRTCDNNRCVVRTGTPPANTRTCSTDADCLSRSTNTPTIAVTNTPTAIPSPTRATGTGTGTGNIAIGFNRYQVNYLSGSDEILYDSDDFQFNAEPSSVLYYPLVVRDWTGGVNLKQWSSFELYNPNNERVSVSFMFYDANVNGAGNPSVFSISMNPNSRLGLDNNNEYQTKWNELLSGRSNGRLMWAKIVTANSNHKIIGINKWRLIDTSKTSRQIVDNEINNLHTKARASWVVPFVVIKESTSNNNDTQWTDLVIANVTRNNARVEIDFVGKIGSNSAIQTKRLEVNIGPYGYYGTYGDNKWYDLFKNSNGQIQTSKGYVIITSSYDVIGLARNRIVEGSNYNGKSMAINDVEFSEPKNILYVPLAFFGEPGRLSNTTQWTDVVIPNLSSSRNMNLIFEFVPLYGSNLYSTKRFIYTLAPKDVLNTFTLQQWKDFGSNNNRFGWVKITTNTPTQNILTGMSRWALREGSQSTGKALLVSDMALTSDIKSVFYVPYIAPKYDLVYNGQPTGLYEKLYFVTINTSSHSMRLNFNYGTSVYNLGDRIIRSYGFFNSYYDSMFKTLQPPTNTSVLKFWLPIHAVAISQGNQPTATPTNTPYIIPTNTPTPAPTSYYSTCENNRCVVRTGTPPANRRRCSVDADCVNNPTSTPTRQPTSTPTRQPTSTPTRQPTSTPTRQPTSTPSRQPTSTPSRQPTSTPSRQPTSTPSRQPTSTPTRQPTSTPTRQPTSTPSRQPTSTPSRQPTSTPTRPIANNTPTNTPSSQPRNIVLTFKVKFQGINNPVVTTLPVNVTVRRAFETGVSKTVTFNYNQQQRVWIGQSSFNLSPSDGYFIYIKGPKHLRKKICDEMPIESAGAEGTYICSGSGLTITNDKVYDFSKITLLAGDLDPQNGVINSYDWALVRNSIGTTDESAIRLADINYDGRVNVQDYTLIMYSLSIKLDEF